MFKTSCFAVAVVAIFPLLQNCLVLIVANLLITPNCYSLSLFEEKIHFFCFFENNVAFE